MPPFHITIVTENTFEAIDEISLFHHPKPSHDDQSTNSTDYDDSDDDDECECECECKPISVNSDNSTANLNSTISGQQRHVQFAETNQVFPTISLNDFTSLEYTSVWYSPHEKCQMRIERERLLSRMDNNQPCDCNPQNEMTYRGLESWTTSGMKTLRNTILQVVDAVMDEQERQWVTGIGNVEEIALKSITVTMTSRQHAMEIGKEDEYESHLQDHIDMTGNVTMKKKKNDNNNNDNCDNRRRRKSWWRWYKTTNRG